jgi:uncharacterized membrane protein
MSQLHYLPLPLPFYSILVGLFVLLAVLIQVGALRYAYMRIGLSPRAALLLLLASLVGSYLNIPVAELPAQQIMSGQVIDYFGMRYVVPVVTDWPTTVIAVNVGGALIPGFTSLYLLAKSQQWSRGILATIGVAAICHLVARPVPGLGIALPVFVPVIATAVIALLLSRSHAAPLAYIGGSLGTLVGADLLNLDKVQGLGAPVASIGGAGTFDGIFVTGILAVLIASLSRRSDRQGPRPVPTVRATRTGVGVSGPVHRAANEDR